MQEFEKHIRLVMQQAEENVPPQVWDAVSRGLDRKRARRIVPVYWRRVAVGLSAAAAVVAGLFLFTGRDHGTTPPVRRMIAREPAALYQPVLVPARDIALLKDRTAWMAERAPEGAVTEAGTVSAREETAPESTPAQSAASARPQSVPEGTARPDDVNRQFNELAFEETRRSSSHPLSFTVGSNIQSNGNPHNGRSSDQRYLTSAAGPIETSVTDTDPYGSYGAPLSFGLGVQFALTPRLAVGTGLFYTRLSRTYHGTFTKVSDGAVFLTVNGSIDNDQDYLGIPLNLYYTFVSDRNFRFYSFLGGAVEKNVGNHYRIQGPEEMLNWSNTAKGFQWSAGAGIGMEFRLLDGFGIYLDPSLRYYFDNDQPRSIRSQQPLMMNLEAGLRFYL